MASRCARGGFDGLSGKIFSLNVSSSIAQEQAAQGNGGTAIPGGF